MTSKLKCPVCQNNLHKINVVVSTCTNDKCKLWGASIPNLVLEAEGLQIARKALDYCIERFKSLENVLDQKAEASDIPDNPDLYAWAVRIKPIWSELKEITGTDYKTEHK